MALFFLLVFILLISLIFALPYLVNLETIKNSLAERLSQRLKSEVEIGEVSLKLLPTPALNTTDVRLKNPRYYLSLKEGNLILKLFPLFHRRIEIEKCLLTGLEVTIKEKKKKSQKSTLFLPSKSIFSKINMILGKIPEVRIKIQNGALYQEKGASKVPLLQRGQIFLALKKDFLQAEIKGQNPALKTLELSLKLWPGEELAEGLLKLKKADLSRLSLLPEDLKKSLKTDFSLDLSFRFEEGKWHLGFTGTAPCIIARRGRIPLLFDCSAVIGKALLGSKLAKVELQELKMKNPLLEARGAFAWQPQKAFFDFQITKADWGEIRKRLLIFLGHNRGFKRFSEIVESGLAENTHFKSEAPSLKALFKLQNLFYEGKALKAKVNIPKIKLSLEEAQGLVKVWQGKLEVKKARGLCEGVFLKKTKLFLDISSLKKKKDSPFFFETQFEGPFKGLKNILKTLPLPSRINQEISGLKGEGKLSGKVKILGKLKKPKVSFVLRPQKVSLEYHRFPLPLKIEGGTISYNSRKVNIRGSKISFPKSYLSGMALIDLASKPWQLDLSEARGVIYLEELNQVLQSFVSLKSYLKRYRLEGEKITLIHASYRGPLEGKSFLKKLSLEFSGGNLRFSCPELPTPLFLEKGQFTYHDLGLSFGPSRLRWFDSSFNVAGEISFRPFRLFLTGRGEAKKQFLTWVFEKGHLPLEFFPKTPLKLSSVEFEKKDQHLRFAGKLETTSPSWANLVFEKDGPHWQLDGALFPSGKESFRFRITKEQKLALALHGEISAREIELFLSQNPFLLQHLKTDLEGVLDLKKPAESYFFGSLEVSRFKIPYLHHPLWLESLSLQAMERKIHINHGEFDLDGTYFETEGDLIFSHNYLSFEGSAYSPYIIVENILNLFSQKKKSPSQNSGPRFKLVAKVDLEAESVIYHGYKLTPFKGAIFYLPGSFRLVITDSYLCDIELRGSLEKKPDIQRLEISFLNPKGRFEETLFCLFHKKDLEGPFELRGELITYGKKLFEKSSGKVYLKSKEGHIYKFGALSKLFAILSPIDIFSGNLPDFSQKGMDYDLLELKGKFKKNYLKIESFQLNAPGLRFFGTGKVYLLDQKIDLTLLVSPFKAFNAVVSRVPLVGWVLTGKSKMLLAVPVRITGKINDPTVLPLDPVSLGSQFLGIVGRTFKLPVKILTPKKAEEKPARSP